MMQHFKHRWERTFVPLDLRNDIPPGSGVSPSLAKAVGLVMLSHANLDGGGIKVSPWLRELDSHGRQQEGRLAIEACCSGDQAKRARKVLQDLGWVKKYKMGHGPNAPWVWRLTFP